MQGKNVKIPALKGGTMFPGHPNVFEFISNFPIFS
jgi:hypothetical protein